MVADDVAGDDVDDDEVNSGSGDDVVRTVDAGSDSGEREACEEDAVEEGKRLEMDSMVDGKVKFGCSEIFIGSGVTVSALDSDVSVVALVTDEVCVAMVAVTGEVDASVSDSIETTVDVTISSGLDTKVVFIFDSDRLEVIEDDSDVFVTSFTVLV